MSGEGLLASPPGLGRLADSPYLIRGQGLLKSTKRTGSRSPPLTFDDIDPVIQAGDEINFARPLNPEPVLQEGMPLADQVLRDRPFGPPALGIGRASFSSWTLNGA